MSSPNHNQPEEFSDLERNILQVLKDANCPLDKEHIEEAVNKLMEVKTRLQINSSVQQLVDQGIACCCIKDGDMAVSLLKNKCTDTIPSQEEQQAILEWNRKNCYVRYWQYLTTCREFYAQEQQKEQEDLQIDQQNNQQIDQDDQQVDQS